MPSEKPGRIRSRTIDPSMRDDFLIFYCIGGYAVAPWRFPTALFVRKREGYGKGKFKSNERERNKNSPFFALCRRLKEEGEKRKKQEGGATI